MPMLRKIRAGGGRIKELMQRQKEEVRRQRGEKPILPFLQYDGSETGLTLHVQEDFLHY
jgi:hypothetical protein